MERFKEIEKKGKIILIIIVFLTTTSFGIYYFFKLRKNSYKIINKEDKIEEKKEDIKEDVKNEEIKEEEDIWIVDVKGEVVTPGIHKVEKDMRINDVIKIAGGLTKNADTSLTNLSKKVYDEMVIIIYSKDRVKEILTKDKLSNECGNEEIIINGSCSTVKESTKRININTATIDELITIPNIGEAKAKGIIEYRKTNKFTSIEDIKNVAGIGDAIFELIKDYIEV